MKALISITNFGIKKRIVFLMSSPSQALQIPQLDDRNPVTFALVLQLNRVAYYRCNSLLIPFFNLKLIQDGSDRFPISIPNFDDVTQLLQRRVLFNTIL